jgi:hypothetical protein
MKHTPKVRIENARARAWRVKEAGNRLAQRLTEQLGHLPAEFATVSAMTGSPAFSAAGQIQSAVPSFSHAAVGPRKLTRTQSHPHA